MRKQEIKDAQSVPKPSVESPQGTGNWPPRVTIHFHYNTFQTLLIYFDHIILKAGSFMDLYCRT